MPDAPLNPFVSMFLSLAHRQMQFLFIAGAATIFFALFGYGISWISFWIVLTALLVLGMFYGVVWFWRGVFRQMYGGWKS